MNLQSTIPTSTALGFQKAIYNNQLEEFWKARLKTGSVFKTEILEKCALYAFKAYELKALTINQVASVIWMTSYWHQFYVEPKIYVRMSTMENKVPTATWTEMNLPIVHPDSWEIMTAIDASNASKEAQYYLGNFFGLDPALLDDFFDLLNDKKIPLSERRFHVAKIMDGDSSQWSPIIDITSRIMKSLSKSETICSPLPHWDFAKARIKRLIYQGTCTVWVIPSWTMREIWLKVLFKGENALPVPYFGNYTLNDTDRYARRNRRLVQLYCPGVKSLKKPDGYYSGGHGGLTEHDFTYHVWRMSCVDIRYRTLPFSRVIKLIENVTTIKKNAFRKIQDREKGAPNKPLYFCVLLVDHNSPNCKVIMDILLIHWGKYFKKYGLTEDDLCPQHRAQLKP